MYKKAADYFLNAALPCGDAELTFADYVRNLSATTGCPMVFCDRNARKVHYVLANIEEVLGGLTRGLDLEALDKGYTTKNGRMQAFYPTTDVFGAVLPSNSPGVHSLWVPTIAFKIPLVLKPGREEPWTPYRVLQAFLKAGVPASALGFLPTDHAGAGRHPPAVRPEHGVRRRPQRWPRTRTTRGSRSTAPGTRKIILGEDKADQLGEVPRRDGRGDRRQRRPGVRQRLGRLDAAATARHRRGAGEEARRGQGRGRGTTRTARSARSPSRRWPRRSTT